MNSLKLFIIFFLASQLMACAPSTRHVWETPDQNLEYISLYRKHAELGSSVLYNPTYCEKIGQACEFFLSQTYAHQVYNDISLPPNIYPKSIEARTDCWAARYVKPEAVLAAYDLMINGSGDVPITGDPKERAEKIKNCAIKYDNWAG